MRRYAGSELGDEYQTVLAWGGEGDHSMPGMAARTLGDVVDPGRPGSVQAVVNATTRQVGVDTAAWPWGRLVGMYGMLEREAQARADG